MDWSQVVLFGIILFLIWYLNRKPKYFPPGPTGLPLVGYLPFVGKYSHETFQKLGKKYGNVLGIQMGNYNVVVLNDWTAIKEALVNQSDVFNGRPQNIVFEIASDYAGVGLANGQGWQDRRRFTLQHLRDFGFGRSSMEAVIEEEIKILCDHIKGYHNKTLTIKHFFHYSLHNVIWSVVGGKRFDQGDKLMHQLSELTDVLLTQLNLTSAIMFMPYLQFFYKNDIYKLKHASDILNKHLESEVNDHIASYQDGCQRDIIDVYLNEIFTREKSGNTSKSFQLVNVIGVIKDLFMGGVDTTNTILSWSLLYMITWPDIQKKVQEELDRVIGRQRLPYYKDRFVLPYTEAVISEIYRYSTIAPLSTVRVTTRATQLFNYTIPKDTLVFPNLWAVHYDPQHWDDPFIFRPERFLNENGEIQRPKFLIPFALGSRQCLGESLARANIFMFFTALLHQFTFSIIPGTKPPTLEPVLTVLLSPQPFSVHVRQR